MKSRAVRWTLRIGLGVITGLVVAFAILAAWAAGRAGVSPRTFLREMYRVETLPACIGIYGSQARNGVRIEQVQIGSPAADSHLTKGMVITALNGAVVTSPQQLAQRVKESKPLTIIGLSYDQTLLGMPISSGSVGVRLGYQLNGHCDNSPLARR